MSLKGPRWEEAVADALWLAAAGSLVWLGPRLADWERGMLWTILGVGLAILLRRFWGWLLGPLFFYDLVRTARRNRLIPARCFYAPAMLLFISITYSRWFGFHWSDWRQLFEPHLIRPDLLSSFANSFFMSFMVLLISASFLLTPIYTATAVVEERARGNLDLLLVTPLTSREIVIGLLASRLATLGLIILTGLPILSMLPFLGGVDPGWVVGTFFLAGFLMVIQGSIGLYVSVRAKDSLRAIVDAYVRSLMIGVFLFCCPCMCAPGINAWSPRFWNSVIPGVPLFVIPGIVGGLVSLSYLAVTVARLRPTVTGREPGPIPPRGWDAVAVRPRLGKEETRFQWALSDLFRLPISDPPMLWKDFHRKRSGNLQILISSLSTGFYLYLLLICLIFESSEAITAIVAWAICILLLPVAIISSRMVSQEREKRTLECLLVTDLDAKEILFGKWWASVFPMRWILVIGALGLGIVALGGPLHPLSFLFLIAATLVYTCFVACLGLFISTLSNTVLKATMIAVVTLMLFVSAGPLGLFSPATNPGNVAEWWLQCVLSYALSPIDAMQVLAFDAVHLEEEGLQILAALSGVVLVGLVSWGLWKLTLVCFARINKGAPASVLRCQ